MVQTTIEPASMITINTQCLDESETSRQNTLRVLRMCTGTVILAKKCDVLHL